MSDSLADLLVTDAVLDRIARRDCDGDRDLVLADLALLAAAVDDVALPPAVSCAYRQPMTSVRKGGWALSVTVALMVTSSGVAAAVSDNPIEPLRYVTTQVWKLGPHGDGKIPGWQLDGAMPISTVAGTSRAHSGADGSAASLETLASAARRAGHPGLPTVGRSGAGPGTSTSTGAGSGFGGENGSGDGQGSGGRSPLSPTGSGSLWLNSKNNAPRDRHGHPPGNVGSPGSGSGIGTGFPGNPSAPQAPSPPSGHRIGIIETGSGPGAADGKMPCRIDRPDVPGSPGWSASSVLVCGSSPTPPAAPSAPTPTDPGQRNPTLVGAPSPQLPSSGAGSSPARDAPKAFQPSRSIP